MPTLRFSRKTALLPVCLAASFAGSPLMAQEQLEEGAQSSAAEPVELQSVEITASADASADGLTQPYAGEQVARGGRVGILGNRDYMETPFTSTSYTSQLIQDQQARSVSDVLQNDPSVRVAAASATSRSYTWCAVSRCTPTTFPTTAFMACYRASM